MTDRSTELKPCPFCGEKPEVDYDERINDDFVVMCENPECTVSISTGAYTTEVDAIAAWNTRKEDANETPTSMA